MQFMITAMCRSGTKSIAQYLGCEHELDNMVQISSEDVQARFEAGGVNYGECSSLLRNVAPYIHDVKKVYIARHPHHIAISGKARGLDVESTVWGLLMLRRAIALDKEAPVFYFEDLVLDATPLAEYVGSDARGPLPKCNESAPGSKEGITLSEYEKNLLAPFLETRDFTYNV